MAASLSIGSVQHVRESISSGASKVAGVKTEGRRVFPTSRMVADVECFERVRSQSAGAQAVSLWAHAVHRVTGKKLNLDAEEVVSASDIAGMGKLQV